MARAPKPAWKIEALLPTGEWGWVLLPPYRSQEAAEADMLRMEKQTPATTYRVVKDADQ
jgi:hypothetical protein